LDEGDGLAGDEDNQRDGHGVGQLEVKNLAASVMLFLPVTGVAFLKPICWHGRRLV